MTEEHFKVMEYLNTRYESYKKLGLLLSNSELLIIQKHISDITDPEILDFIGQSQNAVNLELDLNLKALQEAESAKAKAVEQAKLAQELNKKLEKQKEKVEKELESEKEYNLELERTGFQKQLATLLTYLVAAVILIPFILQVILVIFDRSLPDLLINNTNNIIILLIQILSVIISSLFNKGSNRKNEPSKTGD